MGGSKSKRDRNVADGEVCTAKQSLRMQHPKLRNDPVKRTAKIITDDLIYRCFAEEKLFGNHVQGNLFAIMI